MLILPTQKIIKEEQLPCRPVVAHDSTPEVLSSPQPWQWEAHSVFSVWRRDVEASDRKVSKRPDKLSRPPGTAEWARLDLWIGEGR